VVEKLGGNRDGGGIPGDEKTGSLVSKDLFCKTTCSFLRFCPVNSARRENKKVSMLFLIEYKRYFFKQISRQTILQ